MENGIFERYELKYLVNARQRAALEAALAGRMTPDEHGESEVCSIYFDTPTCLLARRSAEKPPYKEKLRLRSYGAAAPDDPVFLELKKKYKDIVYKRRILLPQREALACLAEGRALPQRCQIAREIDAFARFYGQLAPAVLICCERTALYAKDDAQLRLTFDRAIRFSGEGTLCAGGAHAKRTLLAEGQSLLEVKTSAAVPLWLVHLFEEYGVRRTSFSKYGRAYETLLDTKLKELRGASCA